MGGVCYHVVNRGNGRAEVFHKDGDCDAFVRLFADAHERLPMRVLGYCRRNKWGQAPASSRSSHDSESSAGASPHLFRMPTAISAVGCNGC